MKQNQFLNAKEPVLNLFLNDVLDECLARPDILSNATNEQVKCKINGWDISISRTFSYTHGKGLNIFAGGGLVYGYGEENDLSPEDWRAIDSFFLRARDIVFAENVRIIKNASLWFNTNYIAKVSKVS